MSFEIWKQRICEEIRAYEQGKGAALYLQEKLDIVNDELYAIRGGHGDSEPVKGGTSRLEDKRCALLDKKAALEEDIKNNDRWRKVIAACLNELGEEERKILVGMCCAEYGDSTSKRLAAELAMDESNVRRQWHKAMQHYRRIQSGNQTI